MCLIKYFLDIIVYIAGNWVPRVVRASVQCTVYTVTSSLPEPEI